MYSFGNHDKCPDAKKLWDNVLALLKDVDKDSSDDITWNFVYYNNV